MSSDQQVSAELANRDLSDIAELRKSDAFNRYFMRRLRKRRESLHDAFLTAGAMSHEEREVHRRLILEYDREIMNMLEKDERACRSIIETPF